MKIKPIKNVLRHCQRVDKQYGDSIPPSDLAMWNKNLGWIQAIKYIISTYNCIPKLNGYLMEGKNK